MRRFLRNPQLERSKFIVARINEINEWRDEAVKHVIDSKSKEKIEARVLELREAAERA